MKKILKKLNNLEMALTVAISVMFGIYAPAELLLNNYNELNYTLSELLKYMGLFFLGAVFLGNVVLLIIRKVSAKAEKILLAVGTVFLIGCWIQGSFLSSDLPELNGDLVIWSQYVYKRWESIAVFGAVSIALLFVIITNQEKWSVFFTTISHILIAFMVISIGVSYISWDKDGLNKGVSCSNAYILEYSDENPNFLIILLDSLSQQGFETVYAEHPEYDEVFEDFTSFRNTMCCYPFTNRSIPFILSGVWDENTEPLESYFQFALNNSQLFKSLQERQYDMCMYDNENELPLVEGMDSMFKNIRAANHFSDPKGFIIVQLGLACYRYLPFDLKRFCRISPYRIYLSTIKTDGLGETYNHDNSEFQRMTDPINVTYSERSCFKYIYLWGAHVPFVHSAQSEAFQNRSFESSIETSVTEVDGYLTKLKESGVYDNTVIVIMADHGYVKETEPAETQVIGRTNPILFIKGIGEKHPLEFSDAPISQVDLQQAFERLLEGENSTDCFDWAEGQSRERRFLLYYSGKEETMYEYYQTGHAEDISTMVSTGKVYQLEQ